MAEKPKRLYRSKDDKLIAGVCGGLAEYLEADPTLIRVMWIFLILLFQGLAVLAYLASWLMIPCKKKK